MPDQNPFQDLIPSGSSSDANPFGDLIPKRSLAGNVGASKHRTIGGTLPTGGGYEPVIPGTTPGVPLPEGVKVATNKAASLATALASGQPLAVASATTGTPPRKPINEPAKPAPDRQPQSFWQKAADVATTYGKKPQKPINVPPDESAAEIRGGAQGGTAHQIAARARLSWMKTHGYDPQQFPARYQQDLSNETVGAIEAGIHPITQVGDVIGNAFQLATNPVTQYRALKGENVFNDKPVTSAAAGLLNLPADVVGDAAVLVHPNSSINDRAGAIANIVLKVFPDQAIGIAGKGSKAIITAVRGKSGALADAIEVQIKSGVSDKAIQDALQSKSIEGATKTRAFPREAIDVTEETLNRKALPSTAGPEGQPLKPTAEDSFVQEHWKTRTQGLLNDVQKLIDEQKGSGAKYGPLKRELTQSLETGVPHSSVESELRDIYQKINPGEINATQKGNIEVNPISQHQGDNGLLQEQGNNRQFETGQPKGSTETGRGDQLRGNVPKEEVKVNAVETPKVQAPEAPQGVSHAEIGKLREDLGWQPREVNHKSDTQLFQEAQKLSGKEATIAQKVLADKKATLSDPESVSLGVRLKQLKGEMDAAKKANNVDAFDVADAEAQTIANALDESGSRQGRAFRARRFLLEDQFDSWTMTRRAKQANGDLPLSVMQESELHAHIRRLEANNKATEAQLQASRQEYQNFLDSFKSKRAPGPMNTVQKRQAALNTLRRLGIPVADEVPQGAGLGGMRGKQTGAINIPQGQTEQVAKAVRTLVRSYADEGLETWPKVLKRLQKDLPGIEEDQALYILSNKYKQAKLEADVAKKQAMSFLNKVRRDAEFRTKPFALKALSVGTDVLNTTQRSLQTTLDNSMALIQGKNVLVWKPGTWFKAVGTSLRAFITKDPIGFARKITADIENHPLYPKAVQAKLGLSDIDGPFTRQEEMFAGELENHIPGLSHSKAAATIIANKMRFDLFRKMASVAPNDAAYLADIAKQINIATGKGTGRVAEMLGSKEAGLISYAPRYYLSKWQHNFGVPLLTAKTSAGKLQALKMYGTQLAFYAALVNAAQLFGFKVNLDPRSTDFGVATGKDYSFDIFKQQSEGLRTMAQLIYGRESRNGNFKGPGEYGAYSLGDYAESKLSPMMRSFNMLRTGQTFDDITGEHRAVVPSDFWKSYIPMSIKEMYKNRNSPQTFPLSILGGNVDQPVDKSKAKKPAPPFNPVPPGLKSLMGG